jgi:hypothetical protein
MKPQFTKDHIFILPHADDYRRFYDLSIEEILDCLNTPDLHEGLATDKYTAEKAVGEKHLYVYYYLIHPLHAKDTQIYAIVDFIGSTAKEDLIPDKN